MWLWWCMLAPALMACLKRLEVQHKLLSKRCSPAILSWFTDWSCLALPFWMTAAWLVHQRHWLLLCHCLQHCFEQFVGAVVVFGLVTMSVEKYFLAVVERVFLQCFSWRVLPVITSRRADSRQAATAFLFLFFRVVPWGDLHTCVLLLVPTGLG